MKKSLLFTLLCAAKLAANPTGAAIVQGEVQISECAQGVEIHASDRAVIDWETFSINAGETTRFHQPNAEAAVLNRVQGSSHSQIDGLLEANGRVYLLNPHGVIIGKEGVVIASDFAVTTQDIVDLENWNEVFDRAGCLHFASLPGQGVINCEGIIQATGFSEEGGRVLLIGNQTEVSGSIGGNEIWVLGEHIRLAPECRIEAPGGSIHIGGDYQGANPSIPNSRTILFEKEARLFANGEGSGNGGKIILWSDEATAAHGTIEVLGGPLGGDGGFVEISSKNFLSFNSRVDTRASFGKTGQLLLDPSDITISTAASAPALTTPIYNPAAASANLLDTDISTALATTSLTISTSAGIGGNGDISILDGANVSWNSAHSLTLLANRNISVQTGAAGITVSNAGTGALQFNAPNGAIAIGDTTATNNTIITTGGNISMQAGTGFQLFAANVSPSTVSLFSTSSTGSISIHVANGDFLMANLNGFPSNRAGIGFDWFGPAPISGPVDITTPNGAITMQTVDQAANLAIGSVDRVRMIARDNVTFETGLDPASGVQVGIQVASITGNATRIESTQGSVIIDMDSSRNEINIANAAFELAAAGDLLITNTGTGLANLFNISATQDISFQIGGNILLSDPFPSGLLGILSSGGDVTWTAGGSIAASAANDSLFIAAEGALSITAGGDISLGSDNPILNGCTPFGLCCYPVAGFFGNNGLTLESAGSIAINQGGHLLSGADGFVFAKADKNISLNGNAIIDSFSFTPPSCGAIAAGKDFYVTLVVDDQAPTPPQAGDGRFIMASDAQILSATNQAPVRIFTAFRSQNSIEGHVNGALFSEGPFGVNSDTERWGVWYPDAFVGSPFTVFYKEGGFELTTPVAAIFGEAFDVLSDFGIFGRFLPPYFDDHFVVHYCYPFSTTPKSGQTIAVEKERWNWIQMENYRKFYPERDQFGYSDLPEDYFIPACQEP